jgi:hypothetical protein
MTGEQHQSVNINGKGMTMSENTVVVEVVEDDVKASPKKRNLVKIGRHLARQITRQGITSITVDAVMESKRVDRVQAKAIIKHAEQVLNSRGVAFPHAVA